MAKHARSSKKICIFAKSTKLFMQHIDYLNLKDINSPLQQDILNAIHQVVESGWYLQGKANQQFAEAYAQYIGTQYCIPCGNGLDALKLMLRGEMELGRLHEGDEIIVPANTYIATILAITECRLKPILVEPRWETLQIDDRLLHQVLTPRTKAVMTVHLYGRCAMTETIERFCQQHNLLLFEDNAQAHGCMYDNRKTGSLGNAAAHSFYPGKNLGALGDAGAVTTDDHELAEVVRALGNYGSSRKYVFPYVGTNSRMDEMQAAVLTAKLRHLDLLNEARRQRAKEYLSLINNPKVMVPHQMYDDWSRNVVHIFPVFCEKRDELQTYLSQHGIGTMIHYPIPPHQQTCYKSWNRLSLPITERIHQQELSLPCHQMMTSEETKYIAETINSFQ